MGPCFRETYYRVSSLPKHLFFSYACSRFMKIEIKITLGRIGNFINPIVQMRKLRKREYK